MKTFYLPSTDNDGKYVGPELTKFDIGRIQDRYGMFTFFSKILKNIGARDDKDKNGKKEDDEEEANERPFTKHGFYQARRGDTADKIAGYFEITKEKLKEMNPKLNLDIVKVI